jgi:hypothetical protein
LRHIYERSDHYRRVSSNGTAMNDNERDERLDVPIWQQPESLFATFMVLVLMLAGAWAGGAFY